MKNQANTSDRRRFLQAVAAGGATLAFGRQTLGAAEKGDGPEPIRVGLIGAGEWGRVLMEEACRIPGVRFQAVCDLWPYNRMWVAKRLAWYQHGSNAYEDYREMLDKEKGLQAVLVATPDCWHAEHTAACLNAGLHVYCETEMSNTLAGARRMVEAARKTGKLLQIGRQRRRSPFYNFCKEKLLGEAELLGRITAVDGQWNRLVDEPKGWPKEWKLDEATLTKYGYESMQQLRNWCWYKGLGGGPIVDLGSHQIDIYNWFLGATPRGVIASGSTDYYDKKTHEWYDTVMAIYDFETPEGVARAFRVGKSGSSWASLASRSRRNSRSPIRRRRWACRRHWARRPMRSQSGWAACCTLSRTWRTSSMLFAAGPS